ncbi:hypothetical protein L210DRAFT_990291 [Boletus edulis BED1]|uniref:Uncharacterized protein n=1 Tax=Boletus edulis BED1 TaxID=1328754 RepID=A0AAD4G9X7_BOLED|nr:hypothetical protein L210DRAFT_990291 [Boletus edulis BED1]
MSSPPPLLGPSVLQHLRTSLLLVYYLWTLFHQPQSLRISTGVQQGEIWTLTANHCTSKYGYLKRCLNIIHIFSYLIASY